MWKSSSESLGRIGVVLKRTVVGYDLRYDNLCGSHLQSHCRVGQTVLFIVLAQGVNSVKSMSVLRCQY